jgi:hypothetical protein
MSKKLKKSTALARRRVATPARRVTAIARRPKMEVLPSPAANEGLSERTIVGMLGKIELKLTDKEEAILSEVVNVEDVRVKPSGQAYLSHPTYTRWFNRAFGRLGWSLVPAAAPMKNETGVVVVPYLLHIHGKPAAFAFGEQEWFEGSNREQTYGDALEATVASGLRRCAKRMGVGLELWDRPWTNAYLADHCVEVRVVKKGRDGKKFTARQWRRKVDQPFWNEVTGKDEDDERTVKTADGERRTIDDDQIPDEPAQTRRVEAPAKPQPRDAHHANELQPITEKQLQRLWVIIRNSGRIENAVKAWLKAKYQLDHTKDIARRDYETICAAIESPRSLPL